MTNFKPHPAQLRVLEAIEQGKRLAPFFVSGRLNGRRYATELAIIANASSPEEAQLSIEDLNEHGIALQDKDGKRIDPKAKRPARLRCVRFDEEKRR